MHPEKVREIVREEIAKQLQKPPIPGPSFEGGAGEKWEPKKGDHVQVLRDVAFLKKDEIATVVEVTVDKGVGFAFFCEGALLGWAPFSDLSPVKVIGYDSKAVGEGEPTPSEPDRDEPEQWIPKVGDWVRSEEVDEPDEQSYKVVAVGKHFAKLKLDESFFWSVPIDSCTPAPAPFEPTIPEIIPAGNKPGFLGLIEVVDDNSAHGFEIGMIGPAFDPKYDPTGRIWHEMQKGNICVVATDGSSLFMEPQEYKFIPNP